MNVEQPDPARRAFLERIQRALQSAYLPAARASVPARPPAAPAADPARLAEEFTRELAAVGGQVHGPATPMQAVELTLELIRAAGGQELLAWPDAELPLAELGAGLDAGLNAAMQAAGYTILDPAVPSEPGARRTALHRLARASAGITGAWGGLADTGSLVLPSGPARPRLTSLLPPVHIALLSTRTLYSTLAAYLSAQPQAALAGSNFLLVTGPSRTADIELTLTVGVHGPKVLHVVLVDPGHGA